MGWAQAYLAESPSHGQPKRYLDDVPPEVLSLSYSGVQQLFVGHI